LGTLDSKGNFYFFARVGNTPLLAIIYKTDTLSVLPNRSIPFTLKSISLDPNNFCADTREFSDWAISPTTGKLISYSTYSRLINGAQKIFGGLVSIDTGTAVISCFGVENSTEFTRPGYDNFGGIMFGADGFAYGVNSYTRKYYKINPSTGEITYVSSIPNGPNPSGVTNEIRTDLASCISSSDLLPISFSRFAVTSGGTCKANIAWEVGKAETGDKFYLERSYDGRNFTTVTTINAQAGVNGYSFTDSKTGITNYYRIRGVAKDGDVKYSSVVRFLSDCGGKNTVLLFENLLSGTTINGEVALTKTQNVAFTVLNAAGAKVFAKSSVMTAGVSRFSYNIPTLAKGVYLMQVVMGEEKTNLKFVVQ
jgi:hypothetical protein